MNIIEERMWTNAVVICMTLMMMICFITNGSYQNMSYAKMIEGYFQGMSWFID